jgi:hypothetical protein
LRFCLGVVLEQILTGEEIESGGEIVESEDVFDVAANIFERVLSIEQRDYPAFELAEGVTFQFDLSTLRDKV